MNKIKTLFLAANPTGSPQIPYLGLDKEIREIEEKIRASDYRDSIELVSRWAVRPDDLLQALNEHRPQIVHFSGHGSSAGEIILEDDQGCVKPVSKRALKSLFEILKDNIRVVILNACYSKVQAEGISQVIDCVIGMNAAIGDVAAREFAASFYRALGFGRSIKAAFDQGRLALELKGISGEDIPTLMVRPGIDPSTIFLIQDVTAAIPGLNWSRLRDACRTLSRIGLDRMKIEEIDLRYIVPRTNIQDYIREFLVSEARVFVLVGESGMGKSYALRETERTYSSSESMAIIVYDAPSLSEKQSIIERIELDLQHQLNITSANLLSMINNQLFQGDHQLLVIVDAVNENCYPFDALKQIEKSLEYNYPWLKILITCRPHFWQQARRRGIISRSFYYRPANSDQIYLQLGLFSSAEAEIAYKNYQSVYGFIGPDFNQLPNLFQKRLLDPLLLRLIAEIYAHKPLPDGISGLDIDVISEYMDYLKSDGRLGEKDLEFLKKEVNFRILTKEDCTGAARRAEIIDSSTGQSIESRRVIEEHERRLENLLKTGLLIESCIGAGEDAEAFVRYRYERFQDFFLGRYIYSDYRD